MHAAGNNREACVGLLHGMGCDLTSVDRNLNSAVHLAARTGSDSSVALLAQLTNANLLSDFLGAPNAAGETAAMMAAGADQLGTLRTLLSAGCHLRHADSLGRTAVHWAVLECPCRYAPVARCPLARWP